VVLLECDIRFDESDVRQVGRVDTVTNFHIRYRPTPDGSGLDEPVELIEVSVTRTVQRAARGAGNRWLVSDSIHDPEFCVPVRTILSAHYVESWASTRGKTAAVIDAQMFRTHAWRATHWYPEFRGE
jgi:hypothetical protein